MNQQKSNCFKFKKLHFAITFLVLSTLLVIVPGCGYRIGTLLPDDIDSVAVPLVVNLTREPRIENIITDAIIEQLQLDGTLRLADKTTADSILEAEIINYSRDALRYRDEERATAREYRLNLGLRIVLRNQRTNKIIMQDIHVRGEANFTVSGDLRESERLALPLAAEDLARDVVERMVEGW